MATAMLLNGVISLRQTVKVAVMEYGFKKVSAKELHCGKNVTVTQIAVVLQLVKVTSGTCSVSHRPLHPCQRCGLHQVQLQD